VSGAKTAFEITGGTLDDLLGVVEAVLLHIEYAKVIACRLGGHIILAVGLIKVLQGAEQEAFGPLLVPSPRVQCSEMIDELGSISVIRSHCLLSALESLVEELFCEI